MPGLAVRQFECILCGRHFTLLTQDIILPWTLICDACLADMWEMEEDTLAEHLAAHSGAPADSRAQPHPLESEIRAHLQELEERSATIDEALRDREAGRHAFEQAADGQGMWPDMAPDVLATS